MYCEYYVSVGPDYSQKRFFDYPESMVKDYDKMWVAVTAARNDDEQEETLKDVQIYLKYFTCERFWSFNFENPNSVTRSALSWRRGRTTDPPGGR